LNLGCGTRTSAQAVNIDFSIHARLHRRLPDKLAPLIFRGERLERFRAIKGDIRVHDLRKGIPAEDGTVDAVYHSHVLEHIDREAVPAFFAEVRRVLRRGGIHRVVVPDLEWHVRKYLETLQTGDAHDSSVAALYEQSVRREAAGSRAQRPLRRKAENLLLGDARRRGETHQWMWDRVNLAAALEEAGFVGMQLMDYDRSNIPGWSEIDLDRSATGGTYKGGSIYMEAER
jgi:SAM-dependent methyltransferase